LLDVRGAALLIGFGFLVFVLAWGSLAILGPGKIAPIWPANGVLLAALVRTSRSRWPAWLAAAFLGIGAGGMANGGTPLTTAVLAGCDLIEVTLSALILRWAAGRDTDLTSFRVIVAGGAAALITAAFGACLVAAYLEWIGRPQVFEQAMVWALANALGQMIGAPVVLALTPYSRPRPARLTDAALSLGTIITLAAVTGVVFGVLVYPALFLVFAPLLLVVFRLEAIGAALGVTLMALLAVVLTVTGHGPLANIEDGVVAQVLLLQAFMLTTAGVAFPTAAALADRRRAHDRVVRSEARLKFFGDYSGDVVLRLDLDRRIVDVSPSSRTYGYEPEELIGRVAQEMTHPDDRAAVSEMMEGLRANPSGGVTGTREWRIIHKDGHAIPAEGHAAALRDGDGRLVEFVVVIRNIEERAVAARALAESEARYRLLAENSGDIVLQFDERANILFASGSTRQFGYEPEALIGRNCFSFVHPDDVEIAKGAMRTLVESPNSRLDLKPEYRIRTASGDYVWVQGNPSVKRDEDGASITFTDSIRDISRRRALEEDLERKRAEADQLEAARRAAEAAAREGLEELARVSRALSVGEFATSIAHELNQPIAAIATNCDASLRWLARDPPELDEARQAISRASRDAGRAAAVISRTRDMLTKRPSNFGKLDLNACVEQVLLFAEGELRRTRIEVRRRLAGDLPQVRGDRIQVQQVILNLIRNAMEAMVEGQDATRILTVATALDDASGQALVRIEDNGPGLTPETEARLFEGMFTTKVDGVGLGLPISLSIVDAHGGRLSGGTREGGGAVFSFTLPTAASG
jgi:PAS domain S-box-containing protein